MSHVTFPGLCRPPPRHSASGPGRGATRRPGAWTATTRRSPRRPSPRRGRPRSTRASACSTPPRSTAAERASASSAGCSRADPRSAELARHRHQVHAGAVEARRVGRAAGVAGRIARPARDRPRRPLPDPRADQPAFVSCAGRGAGGRRAPTGSRAPSGCRTTHPRDDRDPRPPGDTWRAAGIEPDRVLVAAPTPGDRRPDRTVPRARRRADRVLAHRPGPTHRQVLGRQPPPGRRTFSAHPMEQVDRVVAELRRIGDAARRPHPEPGRAPVDHREGRRADPRGEERQAGGRERRRARMGARAPTSSPRSTGSRSTASARSPNASGSTAERSAAPGWGGSASRPHGVICVSRTAQTT